MKSAKVKNIMVPLEEYSTVSKDATLWLRLFVYWLPTVPDSDSPVGYQCVISVPFLKGIKKNPQIDIVSGIWNTLFSKITPVAEGNGSGILIFFAAFYWT